MGSDYVELQEPTSDGIEKARAKKRHEDVIAALGRIANILNKDSDKDEIEELKKIAAKLDGVYNAINNIPKPEKQEKQEVSVIVKNEEVVSAFKGIVDDFNKGVAALKEVMAQRKYPEKMKIERNRHSGEIDYVIIDYKK